MRKYFLIIVLIILSDLTAESQERNFNYNIEAIGGYISSGLMPFWLRSNQFGATPLDKASLSLIGSVHKEYDIDKTRIFDWGASIEGRGNLGNKSKLTLI